MIKLGCFDANVDSSVCDAYIAQLSSTTRVDFHDVAKGPDKISFQKYTPAGPLTMSVADVQRGLQSIGFFPTGKIDGICGYRTQSAIRLFQEYVRSIEKKAEMVPDGQFGPQVQDHLQRWIANSQKSEWAKTIDLWRAGGMAQSEHADWLVLLEKVKQKYSQSPNAMLQKLNAYNGRSGTRKVGQWDFASPEDIHLIGIRRAVFKDKFEDIFVLLLKGLVFKFQGSTDPGATKDPRGFPFLVQGQHEYHFGWHKKTYLALKPQTQVLVVRSKDRRIEDADLNNGLEPNETINVHWGGRGMDGDVNDWSEGCQVITGSVYLNPANELIVCRKFAAVRSSDPLTDTGKTRGAYNVLLDLVNTLSTNQTSQVKYMLLLDEDMNINPTLKEGLDDARRRVLALI